MVRSHWWWIRRRGAELALAAATLAHTAPPAPPPVTEVVFSSTRRVALRTADRARDVPLLALVEDLLARLEESLGEPFPAPPGHPWLVIVEREPATNSPRAIRVADLNTRGMGRTLRLIRPEELPPSAILVSLVATMVARHVASRQPPAEADAAPRWPPEWFAAGLAGTLYPAPRQAWLRRAAEEWSTARDPPLEELLTVPPGHADERTLPFHTALVNWLRRRPDFPRIADQLLRAAAAGRPIGPVELATAIDASWTARDLAQAWDLALGGLRRLETPWGESTLRRIARLRETLRLDHGEIPVALPPETPVPLSAADLLRAADQPWVPPLAAQMLAALNHLPLGAEPELNEIAADHRRVLEALTVDSAGQLDRLFRAVHRSAMLRRLASAEQRLDDLEALAAAEEPTTTPEQEVEALIRRDAALFPAAPAR
ncbi:MAG: hypothetical protein N2652_09545 [Kiritimatiellae bacterium]|nr:hypothetical protein [Kiritimatiellia bacterium]